MFIPPRLLKYFCRMGSTFTFFPQVQSAEKAAVFLKTEGADMVIGLLFQDLPHHDAILACAEKIKLRVGLGENIPPDFSTVPGERIAEFDRYMAVIYCI
ncbi:MAG: hypothetical protein SWO11_07775 [Thermodesulfobacteriota bacterium]|nr:hypothetical protein [Thermodesulfobacteriota bacterium]